FFRLDVFCQLSGECFEFVLVHLLTHEGILLKSYLFVGGYTIGFTGSERLILCVKAEQKCFCSTTPQNSADMRLFNKADHHHSLALLLKSGNYLRPR
ncbi:MAG: hypothetical protein ACRC7D_02535, partial [Aeromonas popoffii]|uniref:hypothetical protein n=1 Tax=Aeromonas popoffii TaxID=70856 RepID=UPI003F3FFB62